MAPQRGRQPGQGALGGLRINMAGGCWLGEFLRPSSPDTTAQLSLLHRIIFSAVLACAQVMAKIK